MPLLETAGNLMTASLARMGAGKESRYNPGRDRPQDWPIIRTPDEMFCNLAEFPFQPNYVMIKGLRVHYLDEGPTNAAPVLLMHGEPSWCYLYRKMIGPLVRAGHRVIAPDLIGFGRSDKLVNRADYSYQLQVDVITGFIKALDLSGASLFCQDWGGLIGLRVAAENQDRFARIAAANTALVAPPSSFPTAAARTVAAMTLIRTMPGFMGWLAFSQVAPSLDAGRVLQFGTVTRLSPETIAAYNAPFPDARFTAGPRAYPTLVGSQPEANARAWQVLTRWRKPFLTLFSDKDVVLKHFHRIFRELIPGAQGQPHVTIRGGGHFVQEDKGEELARLVNEWMRTDGGKK